MGKLTGHTTEITCFDIPDNPSYENLLLSGSSDTCVKLWDTDELKCIATLKGHTQRVNDVKFSPDASWAASGGSDNQVIVNFLLKNSDLGFSYSYSDKHV